MIGADIKKNKNARDIDKLAELMDKLPKGILKRTRKDIPPFLAVELKHTVSKTKIPKIQAAFSKVHVGKRAAEKQLAASIIYKKKNDALWRFMTKKKQLANLWYNIHKGTNVKLTEGVIKALRAKGIKAPLKKDQVINYPPKNLFIKMVRGKKAKIKKRLLVIAQTVLKQLQP